MAIHDKSIKIKEGSMGSNQKQFKSMKTPCDALSVNAKPMTNH